MRIREGMRRKWSKWWSEKYRRMKMTVKRMVRKERKRVHEEWNLNVAESFKENNKTFRRE